MSYIIINMATKERWHSLAADPGNSVIIPSAHRPSTLHTDREAAMAELKRLCKSHPNEEFFLFQCTHGASLQRIPATVNIHGQPLSEQVVAIVYEDTREEAPF